MTTYKCMNMMIKGKVYLIVARPAVAYGAETWALKKAPGRGRRNANATMDVHRRYKAGQDKR